MYFIQSFKYEKPCFLVVQIGMRTLADSQLAVSIYPAFSYNSLGGGGIATAVQEPGSDRVYLTFDTSVLNIPSVTGRTASVLGIPIPPPFVIAVKPTRLEVHLAMHL